MNKFNQYSESLNKKSTGYTYYTGLSPVKVLAINPDTKKLEEIIGDVASKFDTSYALRKSNLNESITVRPVVIWVTDKDQNISPTILSIDLAQDVEVASTGSKRIINDKNQSTWSESIETVTNNEKMQWFSQEGIREARVGEVDYYKFIAQVMRFDFKGDVNFITMCKDTGIDFDSVYNGNFKGLAEMVEWLNTDEGEKMPNYFVGLWVVNKKDDGKLRQELLNKSDLWYRCTHENVTTGHKEALIKYEKGLRERGKNLTSRLYTYDFQEFDESKCVNSIPAIPTIAPTEDLDWLND